MCHNPTLNDMKLCSARALIVQLLAFVLLALGNPAKLGAVTVTVTPPAVTYGWGGSSFYGVMEIAGQDYYNYSYAVTATVSGAGSSGASASVSMWWGSYYTVTTDVAGRGPVTVTVTVTGTPLPWGTATGNEDASASTTITIGDIEPISPATEFALKGTTLIFSATATPGACTLPDPVWTTTGGGTITGSGLSGTFVADASIRGLGTLTISATGATAQTATVEEIDLTDTTGPAETIEGSLNATFFVAPSQEPAGLTYTWGYFQNYPLGAGNGGPSIGFSDQTAKSTGLSSKAHWFAFPNAPSGSSPVCTYMVACQVGYKGGLDLTPTLLWNVRVPNPMGWTDPPTITGTPSIETYMIGGQTRYHVTGINTLASGAPPFGYNLEPASEFMPKTVAHEAIHISQFESLLNSYLINAYSDSINSIDDSSLLGVTLQIKLITDFQYIAYLLDVIGKKPTWENEAFSVSDPMTPVYLSGLE